MKKDALDARPLMIIEWAGKSCSAVLPEAEALLSEFDMVDVFTAALAIDGEAMPDDLHDFRADTLGELVSCLAAGQEAAVLDGALDELVGLEGLFGLLGDGIGDVGLADVDDGVEMVREGAELADLLAGESHVLARFLRER